MSARVREIYVGSEREGQMVFTSTVQATAGKGLAGDRYALGIGSYSRSKGCRDVTLISTGLRPSCSLPKPARFLEHSLQGVADCCR